MSEDLHLHLTCTTPVSYLHRTTTNVNFSLEKLICFFRCSN
ncbi:uncharacterized protein M6B38_344540 [Iris pallida]|uniref:Uncharacterized protein n=1 Tax=Iris pallida TaxID=29817 RepID=A0AAX6GVW4_IRIPA|nr:uncharacterized protein M6B38_344540 [Iris pallida]